MYEFCFDCFKKTLDPKVKKHNVIIDYEEPDVCEICGERKPVVVRYKKTPKTMLENLLKKRIGSPRR